MQISLDAQNDFDLRTREILAANLAAADRDAELYVLQDEDTYRNGAGEDIRDEYETAAESAAYQIEEETRNVVGGHSYWQGRDGWYFTALQADGMTRDLYDDDHGPYADKTAVLDAIAEQREGDDD